MTVLYIDQSPRQVKLGLTIGAHETIQDLRVILSKDTGIELEQLLLTEIDDLTFRRTFHDSQCVSVLKPEPKDKKESNTNLYCIELPKRMEASEGDGAFIMLTWVNVLKEGPIERRFGSPYTIQVNCMQHLCLRMLRAPPLIPRIYISRYSKIDLTEGC